MRKNNKGILVTSIEGYQTEGGLIECFRRVRTCCCFRAWAPIHSFFGVYSSNEDDDDGGYHDDDDDDDEDGGGYHDDDDDDDDDDEDDDEDDEDGGEEEEKEVTRMSMKTSMHQWWTYVPSQE